MKSSSPFNQFLRLVALAIFVLIVVQIRLFNRKNDYTCEPVLSSSLNNEAVKTGNIIERTVVKETDKIGFNCPQWEQWRKNYIHCLLVVYGSVPVQNLWQYWHSKYVDCLLLNNVTDVTKTFRLIRNTNKDDVKVAVQPPGGYGNQSCIVVTLGVGGDITAEQKMKATNPTCRFFGADPIKQYGQNYTQIGNYFEMAVGANKGEFNSSVKNGPGIAEYTVKVIPVIDLVSFLLHNVSESVIDHLWMDNEGPEYELLPLMVRGGILDKNNITICQINAELHWPLQKYNMNAEKFGNMTLSFAKDSDYIVLEGNGPGGHQRPFYFNAFNPYCVNKFLGDWCV